MIEAVIFDLDGVIVHTDEFHFLSWKWLADGMNIYFDREINKRCLGISRYDSLDIILQQSKKQYSKEEKQVLAEQKNAYYIKYLQQMTANDLSSDVKDTLNVLRQKGLKLAIGSCSKNARLILKQIGLNAFFDVVVDGTNIKNGKPNPEVFLTAAQLLNVDAVNCAVVDDAVSGINAGKKAKMMTIGFGEVSKLKIADFNCEKLIQITNLI